MSSRDHYPRAQEDEYLVDTSLRVLIPADLLPGVEDFVHYANEKTSPNRFILARRRDRGTSLEALWKGYLMDSPTAALRAHVETSLMSGHFGRLGVMSEKDGTLSMLPPYRELMQGLVRYAPPGMSVKAMQETLNEIIVERLGREVAERCRYVFTHQFDPATQTMIPKEDLEIMDHPHVKLFKAFPSLARFRRMTSHDLGLTARQFEIDLKFGGTRQYLIDRLSEAWKDGREMLNKRVPPPPGDTRVEDEPVKKGRTTTRKTSNKK